MASSSTSSASGLPSREDDSEDSHSSAPEADEDDFGMPLTMASVMANRKRKARDEGEDEGEDDEDADDDESSSSSSASSSSASSSSAQQAGSASSDAAGAEPEILQVDFEFNDTEEIDFHGIKQLLERSAWAATTNVSEVADALVNQVGVGTCVKIDDTYNCVYGLISALSVAEARKTNLKSVDEMCTFLQKVCPDPKKADALRAVLTDEALQQSPMALLVNERYVNMPPELTPVIHRQLVEDLNWSVEKLEPAGLRAQWNLKQLLVVSRCFVDGNSSSGGGGPGSGGAAVAGNNNNLKKKKKKKRRKKAAAAAAAAAAAPTPADAGPLTYFLKYEDEIFLQNSSLSFFFDASRIGVSKSPAHDTAFGRESYLVALIDVDKLPACIESMEKMLEGLQEK